MLAYARGDTAAFDLLYARHQAALYRFVRRDWLMACADQLAPSSEDQAFWRAAGAQLLHCLDALPDAQRAAFLLHHEDGASIEDLAQRPSLPFETAKSRLRHALKKLRGCIRQYLAALEAA